MRRQSVKGMELRSIGYDKVNQVLEIEFHNGWIYQYFNVPAYVHKKLVLATSHDSFYKNFIKNVYSFTKVG